jgi:hypothetical protein
MAELACINGLQKATNNKNENQHHRIDHLIESPLHRKPFDQKTIRTKTAIWIRSICFRSYGMERFKIGVCAFRIQI